MNAPDPVLPPCPECGKPNAAGMGSTCWGHGVMCCGDLCGYAHAYNPVRIAHERLSVIDEADFRTAMRDRRRRVRRLKRLRPWLAAIVCVHLARAEESEVERNLRIATGEHGHFRKLALSRLPGCDERLRRAWVMALAGLLGAHLRGMRDERRVEEPRHA